MIKRATDLTLLAIASLVVIIPFVIVCVLVYVTSRGPIFYWSDRVGVGNRLFRMPKFRTMKTDTPTVATHLLPNPESFLTPVGSILRKLSLDELPQLWSILRGDMSFVGPRPALFNQYDLIELRSRYGIEQLRPGLTGLAQVSGRDELTIAEKVDLDRQYLLSQSFRLDLKIIAKTFVTVLGRNGVSH